MHYRRVGIISLAIFIATIFAANWLVNHYGIVSVGFGLHAPAAVFAVGVAFTARDLVQRTIGRWFVIGAIVVGASLSYFVAPTFALASGGAFLCSELADFLIYTPLSDRNFMAAVVLSNTVGAALDSYLFLTWAFGSLTFFWGQFVGKSWMTLAAVPVVLLLRQRIPGRDAQHAEA